MNITEKQRDLTTQLTPLKTGEARLAWMVERAKQQPTLPVGQRVDANLVPGCLARLWLVAEFRDGHCYFTSDSDSLIVKSIAGLLCDFYSGLQPRDILAHNPDFLGVLGITQHLTPNRRNALSRVWDLIKHFATEHSR